VSPTYPGYETWVHHFEVETERILDVPILNPPGRKIRLSPSVDKVMIIIFWDCEGMILVDVMPRRWIITPMPTLEC